MEDQRVRLTKKLLKTALVELLYVKPIQKISIKEICEKANINRTTFYKHYSDEYTLLREIKDEFIADITKTFYMPGEEKTLEKYLENIKEAGKTSKAIIINACDLNTQMEFFNKRTIEAMSDPKLFKSKDLTNDEYELLATYIAGGAFAILGRWANSNYSLPPAEVAKLIRGVIERTYQI